MFEVTFFFVGLVVVLWRLLVDGIYSLMASIILALLSSIQPFIVALRWIDGKHGFRSWHLWTWLWKRAFQHEVHLVEAQEHVIEDEPTIYACYPHGLFPLATFFTAALCGDFWLAKLHRPLPYLLASSLLVRLPIIRQCCQLVGITDVSRSTLKALTLQHKRSVCLLPGGVREMVLSNHNLLRLYVDPNPPHVHEHRGFLEFAFVHKIAVAPIYHENQHRLFHVYVPGGPCGLPSLIDKIRHWTARSLGYPFPSFTFGPFPVPLRTHIGRRLHPSHYSDSNAFIDAFYVTLFRMIITHTPPSKIDTDLFQYMQQCVGDDTSPISSISS